MPKEKYPMTHEQYNGLLIGHIDEVKDAFRERQRQLDKFGPQNRTPTEWFLILSEEVGEAAKECVEMQFDDANHPHADPDRYYKELTEVVAVGLAAMQNYNQRKRAAKAAQQ
ncbi:hypothetical protein GCM10023185_14690 [Hymenobacter saemangeumensis]|uniref:Uncharacterized protein n=1 Tax=Hymenobacter saemangeumensis TaxID=1084522 RepID=A0ABP8I8R3_9BACT